jgi:hypothetical protein
MTHLFSPAPPSHQYYERRKRERMNEQLRADVIDMEPGKIERKRQHGQEQRRGQT